MCIYVDDDDYSVLLGSGERKARKEHTCQECQRAIGRGERYQFWTSVGGEFRSGVETMKMCAHCWAAISTAAELTGCPRQWYWEMVFNGDADEGGCPPASADGVHAAHSSAGQASLADARRFALSDSGCGMSLARSSQELPQ